MQNAAKLHAKVEKYSTASPSIFLTVFGMVLKFKKITESEKSTNCMQSAVKLQANAEKHSTASPKLSNHFI